jgi:glycosyltransferase involved in cell wall biosynthesis
MLIFLIHHFNSTKDKNFMDNNPILSVIIASYNSKNKISHCLKSLELQTIQNFEIIVVDSSSDDTSECIRKNFPNVKLHQFFQRKFPGDARNIGIQAAQSDIIAFIDADCQAKKDWAENIVKSHESQDLIIGGSIANGNPKSYIGWGAYFCEFSHWMPGISSGYMDDIAGANLSYKKKIFGQYGDFIEGTYCSDTEFHWRVQTHGYRPLFNPSIRIAHTNIDDLKTFLAHEIFHGRSFARVRMKNQNFPAWKRCLYIIGLPLIILRIFIKIFTNNIKAKVYFSAFIRSLPVIIGGVICWSLGETIGYAKK